MGAFCWVAGNLGGSLHQPQITMSYLPDYEPVEFTSRFDFADTEHFVDESFAEDIITDVSHEEESKEENSSYESMNAMLGQLALERRSRRGGDSADGDEGGDDIASDGFWGGGGTSPPLPALMYIHCIHYIHEFLLQKYIKFVHTGERYID